MNWMKFGLFTLMALMILTVYIGCQSDSDDDDDSGGDTQEMAPITLTMIDAPVDDAENIFLTLTKIYVHPKDADDSQGDEEEKNGGKEGADDPGFGSWIELEIEPATYDLLELQNNAGVLLADQELPVGDYNQIRLMLDCSEEAAPSIVVEGQTYPLTVPSGCESGFKLPGQFSVAADVETGIIMDFDARKSITVTGNDEYILKPVVRIVQADQSGLISGTIDPAGVRTVIYAFESGDYSEGNDFENAVNSTIADGAGGFVLAALPVGVYDIVIQAEGYATDIYAAQVEVTAGQDSNLGTITLIAEE